MGLAIGRIGCYLNGCCWGQVACEECRTIPLGAAHFPLLPAHARQGQTFAQSSLQPIAAILHNLNEQFDQAAHVRPRKLLSPLQHWRRRACHRAACVLLQ